MPRPLKRGMLGASTIILSKDIDEYAFIMCALNFYEKDFSLKWKEKNNGMEFQAALALYNGLINCYGHS